MHPAGGDAKDYCNTAVTAHGRQIPFFHLPVDVQVMCDMYIPRRLNSSRLLTGSHFNGGIIAVYR